MTKIDKKINNNNKNTQQNSKNRNSKSLNLVCQWPVGSIFARRFWLVYFDTILSN